METRTEVRPVKVRICCEDCSKKPNPGCELEFSSVCLTAYPPKHEHICPLCNRKYYLGKIYPCIEYEEVTI